MCERGSAGHTAQVRGQRCYCLTHCNNTDEINERVSACVHSLHRGSSDICTIINHTHTHTQSLWALLWTLLLFYGLTCHDGGMTATLSEREERKWERVGAVGRCGFGVDGGEGEEVSVEKERGDERQAVKQVQRQREAATHQMCSLVTDSAWTAWKTIHVNSSVGLVISASQFILHFLHTVPAGTGRRQCASVTLSTVD